MAEATNYQPLNFTVITSSLQLQNYEIYELLQNN